MEEPGEDVEQDDVRDEHADAERHPRAVCENQAGTLGSQYWQVCVTQQQGAFLLKQKML